MSSAEIAIWGTIIGALLLFLGWLLPSPKDRQREREQSITGRLTAIETDHRQLERQHIESIVKLSSKVEVLAAQMTDLIQAVRELTTRMNNHRVG